MDKHVQDFDVLPHIGRAAIMKETKERINIKRSSEMPGSHIHTHTHIEYDGESVGVDRSKYDISDKIWVKNFSQNGLQIYT